MSTESVLLLLTLNGSIFRPLAPAQQSVPYHIERGKAGYSHCLWSSCLPNPTHYLLTDFPYRLVVLNLFEHLNSHLSFFLNLQKLGVPIDYLH